MSSGMVGRLEDLEYRREYGAESAKLETAVAFARARENAGHTQAAVAQRAGVSQAYIAKLERGDANPTVGQLGRMLAVIWSHLRIDCEPLGHFEVYVSQAPGPSEFEDFILDEVRSERSAPGYGESSSTGTAAVVTARDLRSR